MSDAYNNIVFGPEQKTKLTQLVNEGMQVMREVETLNEGLRDTVKAVAEELQIKPSILNKAIKIAHKADFTREQQDHQMLEDILSTVGHTL
jgi:DNA-binding MarR family transcriptional regulator